MDIQLNGIDGMEITKEIKKIPPLKNIPVVILTASVMNDQKEKYLEICDDFLKKPISKNQ